MKPDDSLQGTSRQYWIMQRMGATDLNRKQRFSNWIDYISLAQPPISAETLNGKDPMLRNCSKLMSWLVNTLAKCLQKCATHDQSIKFTQQLSLESGSNKRSNCASGRTIFTSKIAISSNIIIFYIYLVSCCCKLIRIRLRSPHGSVDRIQQEAFIIQMGKMKIQILAEDSVTNQMTFPLRVG